MNNLALFIGRLVITASHLLNLGAGGTWPGEIALKIAPRILSYIAPQQVILIAGTNGKTTTSLLMKTILENNGLRAVHNATGANLLNGIVSACLASPRTTWGIFEVDENHLSKVLQYISPKAIVLLNLFRDQLDRYGEVDNIAKNWQQTLTQISPDTELIVNADDPALAHLVRRLRNPLHLFGLGSKKLYLSHMQHATDSIFCPQCGTRLHYEGVYFSHLGDYSCPQCHFSHPENQLSKVNFQLEGVYNKYNVLAAVLTAQTLGLNPEIQNFKPAFGRSEEIGQVKILLSKNPTGFNESLRTVLDSSRKGPLLLALNDRLPDGRDVSWIWDVDFEMLTNFSHPIYVTGDRKLDLALRLKYAQVPCEIKHNLKVSWILPTYSAMLDIRKELTGRKIL